MLNFSCREEYKGKKPVGMSQHLGKGALYFCYKCGFGPAGSEIPAHA